MEFYGLFYYFYEIFYFFSIIYNCERNKKNVNLMMFNFINNIKIVYLDNFINF